MGVDVENTNTCLDCLGTGIVQGGVPNEGEACTECAVNPLLGTKAGNHTRESMREDWRKTIAGMKHLAAKHSPMLFGRCGRCFTMVAVTMAEMAEIRKLHKIPTGEPTAHACAYGGCSGNLEPIPGSTHWNDALDEAQAPRTTETTWFD